VTITVTPVNDRPSFAGSGVGPAAALAVLENSTAVTTLKALDVDGPALTYSLGGADRAAFVLQGGTLRFATAPDFERPADRDRDNIYEVTVIASDGTLSDSRALLVSVLDAPGNTVRGTSQGERIDLTHRIAGKGATNEGDTIDGKSGKDTIAGAAGDDTLLGSKGDDRLRGDAGDDWLMGGAGKDRLDGGAGRDTADYSDARKTVVLELDGAHDARVRIGSAAEDWVRNVENVVGGRGADKLTGDKAANVLAGNGGNDVLAGGAGADTLTGGAGRDRFVFDSKLKASSADTITDFRHDLDRIGLDDKIFKAIGTSLSRGEFYARAGVTEAHDRSDSIVYDKASGDLYFDKDGKGGLAAILFATLSGHPVLDAGDFVIV
jgi:Ca2+-binding RTX toxin-like protein